MTIFRFGSRSRVNYRPFAIRQSSLCGPGQFYQWNLTETDIAIARLAYQRMRGVGLTPGQSRRHVYAQLVDRFGDPSSVRLPPPRPVRLYNQTTA